MSAERVPVRVPSIESLADRYALFLFDQFGVLHDGVNAFPGMRETLVALGRAGCAVGVITNSGKRAAYNRERLAGFGFDASLIDVVASSGEVAWRELCDDGGRRRVLIVRRGTDAGFLDGLPLIETDDAHECELVLIGGCEPERLSLDAYRERLAPAARRGVPALCTNPDRILLLGGGRTGFAPGVVADAYEALGGPVRRIGKPWPAIYAHALAEQGVTPRETLCIGDSVEHDIAGAQAVGCDSLLVATGIHAGASDSEREALYEAHRVRPTWILDA